MFLRELFEASKTAVFAFGRMNPPTIGHAKLVDVIKSQQGEPFLFLTHTQKPKTDPLSFAEKVFFAQKSFSGIAIGDNKVRTIIDAMKSLEAKGYTDIIYVAGSDRVDSFTKLLNDYNGKDYTFDSINIVSAGQRDPDAEGAEGMSASKMKAAAAENDFETFKSGVAGDENLAQEMFDKVKAGMGVEENLDELVVKQEKSKIDVLNNIASRSDGKPFPLSWNADDNEITVGGKLYISPSEANKFLRFYDTRSEDEQELMQKALRSASTTANLFKNLNFKFDYEQDERAKEKNPKAELRKGFDPDTMAALANIRKKYPNAQDPIDAILKYLIDIDADNDSVDDKLDTRMKMIVQKFKSIEPKLAKIDARIKKIEMESKEADLGLYQAMQEGEVRDKYCSPKCCGADVKREDCACKPDCPHCNCNKKELDENFADGKKKGKSRPGRVKKSGASCNGSVTSLRAKAKKASGEKAKMYHWCANMKSGKKK